MATTSEYIYYWLGKVESALHVYGLNAYYEELKSSNLVKFLQDVTIDEPTFSGNFHSIDDFRFTRILTYCLMRRLRPKNIIETGVMHGLSTVFIMQALNNNKYGQLFSIDLPSHHSEGPASDDGYIETLPPQRDPAWIAKEFPIDKGIKWKYIQGASQQILPTFAPNYLSNNNGIDLFIHDSDHSYENMIFELTYALSPEVKSKLIICDNIEANIAFYEMTKRCSNFVVIPNFNDDHFFQPRTGILAP